MSTQTIAKVLNNIQNVTLVGKIIGVFQNMLLAIIKTDN